MSDQSKGKVPDVEYVGVPKLAEQILPDGIPPFSVRRERAAEFLSYGLLATIVIVLVALILRSWITAPSLEDVSPGGEVLNEEAVAMLKTLKDMHLKGTLETIHEIVGSILLPLFTLMLGYVFGSAPKESG